VADRYLIAVLLARPEAIHSAPQEGLPERRVSSPADHGPSILHVRQWAARRALALLAHVPGLARDPDLADPLVPVLAHGLAQEEHHPQVKHLAHSVLPRVDAADGPSTPRPRKAR
jgi:hypothetical protein